MASGRENSAVKQQSDGTDPYDRVAMQSLSGREGSQNQVSCSSIYWFSGFVGGKRDLDGTGKLAL